MNPRTNEDEIEAIRDQLRGVERGLVVAGRLSSREEGEAAARLAESLGWPLIADVGSQIRIGVASENFVAHHDILLADENLASNAPGAVMHIGGGVVSKRLLQFIARHRPNPYIVTNDSPERLDPNHLATHRVESDVAGFCRAFSKLAAKEGEENPWLSMWLGASGKVARRIEEVEEKREAISEPFVVRTISRSIPDGHGLVVASSMPIRDMDAYAVSEREYVPVAANRGASGIDGTVATAAGFARGSGWPATLVIGDLALLHDINSLAMLRSLPVTVVAINNDGGGIFSFLPVSKHEAFFEEYFGTPQGLGFEHAAAMFGLGYERPETMREFEDVYRDAGSRGAATIIEVRTNRDENVALHREMLAEKYLPERRESV